MSKTHTEPHLALPLMYLLVRPAVRNPLRSKLHAMGLRFFSFVDPWVGSHMYMYIYRLSLLRSFLLLCTTRTISLPTQPSLPGTRAFITKPNRATNQPINSSKDTTSPLPPPPPPPPSALFNKKLPALRSMKRNLSLAGSPI